MTAVSVELRTVTFAERPQLRDEAAAIGASVWPEYNRHGDVVGRLWSRLTSEHPGFQFALVDASDETVALGFTLPCRWDATVAGLSAGIDGVFDAAFADEPPTPDTLCAVAAEVAPERRRAGLSYPLTPIERYAAWTRTDGMPFDPWVRLHVRLGADILHPEPRSLRITAPVADWERWTGLALPESGEYVFPDGLAPLSVDCEQDVARYREPNVWVRHPST
ncbi:MAG: GNAT family N-acetyltransferase [Solirubrobacteraceae bacterium]